MPVASELSEEDFESTVTAENEMFAAEGLDRKNLRTELSQVMDLDVFDDRYMEREERTALDPRAIDLDATPRGMQEIGGEGVEVLEIEGRRYDTFVHTDGFTVNPVTDSVDVQRQEMALRERMAFLHDAYFLTGVDGISQSPSVFDYMRNNIPDERTFDLENFDGDSGDVDLVGHEEDFFAVEALDAADFRLLDFNDGWDTMIGGRGALTSLNAREGTDSGTAGPSYRDRLQEDDLIQNFMLLPPERRLNVAPRDSDIPRDEFPSFQLVDPDTAVNPSGAEVGDDEAFVFPDMDTVSEEFWRVGESGSPMVNVADGRGGDEHHDYTMRYTHFFNPTGEYPNLADCLHLKNVSALYGNQ